MAVRIGVTYARPGDAGDAYLDGIRAAGAEPTVLATPDNCRRWPDRDGACQLLAADFAPIRGVQDVDGILFTGGVDVSPMLYHEPMNGTENSDWSRDYVETEQFWLARRRHLPILGICRGLQFLNVITGGSLVQHLSTDVHRDPTGQHKPRSHQVAINPKSRLAKILADATDSDETEPLTIEVNSYHHQGVTTSHLSPTLLEAASSVVPGPADSANVIEAIESAETREGREFVLAIQWHPERMSDPVSRSSGQRLSFQEISERIFRAFVAEARRQKSGLG
ncbi:MAG: gamma-glutamyl-gamma-aminobutyrate hydrolase family protein [Chloroflexota bacterium]